MVDSQLSIKFSDTLAGSAQFSQFAALCSGSFSDVDPVLAAPAVDRLHTDLEVLSNLRDGPSYLDEIKSLPPNSGD